MLKKVKSGKKILLGLKNQWKLFLCKTQLVYRYPHILHIWTIGMGTEVSR